MGPGLAGDSVESATRASEGGVWDTASKSRGRRARRRVSAQETGEDERGSDQQVPEAKEERDRGREKGRSGARPAG